MPPATATRGGLASALNEMAEAAGVGIEIDEAALPLRDEVRGVCEILGLDPLYLANEGTLVLFVPPDQAEAALAAMRAPARGRGRRIIGRAVRRHPGQVRMPRLSAAAGSSTCWSASSCRASAENELCRQNKRGTIMRRHLTRGLAAFLAVLPAAAMAHTGTGAHIDAMHGFLHPLYRP